MLDFLMAPTAFLMGCHLSHFEEVAAVSTPNLQISFKNQIEVLDFSWFDAFDASFISVWKIREIG